MKIYNILLPIIVLLLVIYFLSLNNNTMTSTKFVKINNKLDNEHNQIFKKLDELYDCCEKHWKTEKKMLKSSRTKVNCK